MDRLREVLQSKVLRFVVAGVVVIAGVAIAITVTKGPSTYRLNVVYSSAPGLFPGAAVDVLGVPVGTVSSVQNVDDRVEVGLSVHSTTRIPSKAVASLVAPQVLGQPDVDLNPGYTGGPHLAPGATIPESRTSVPVSTDQFLKELQRTLKALNPHAVGDLITNLAQDLDGQGAGLNQLIKSAAGTIQLLANKGNDLGQLNGTLAQLTGTLDTDTSQIEQLVQQYDTVSTVIAQHSGQLNDALTQLTGATTSLVTLLTPNLQPLEADVGTVTTVGRTLDRNLGSVDQILQQTNNLFQGAQRAVDPTYNWLNLNLALPVGVTGAYVAGLLEDSLEGICRRIYTNQTIPAGPELTALQNCGNPASNFFAPIINEIPTILSSLTGTAAAPTENSLLQQGLNKIESIGATPSTSNAPTTTGTGVGAPTTVPSAPSTPPNTTTTTTPSSGTSCGLLKLLGCSGKSTSSSGLGGLLSQDFSSTTSKPSTVHLVSSETSGPSLTAPAARYLPPMPSSHHAKAAHRGLLSQWAHDVRSWL